MYAAWLMLEDSFKDVYFPDQENWVGKIVLHQQETGLNYDVYFDVHILERKIYITPNAPLTWKSNNSRTERPVAGDTVFVMRDARSGRELTILITQCEKEWLNFTKYKLPKRRVVIGRSEKADIRDGSKLMTAEHGFLGYTQEGYVRYQDQSSNGTYINGKKHVGRSVRLNYADVLAFPTGLKVVFLNDVIAVNRTAFSRVDSLERVAFARGKVRMSDDREIPSVFREYQRAPRMLKRSEVEDVEIEGPIPKQEGNKQPLILQLGPSMTMVFPMLMGTLVASRGGSSMLTSGLVMISTSSALAVMWGFLNRRYRKRQEVETEQRRVGMYHQYITEMEQKLLTTNQKEYKRLMETFPSAVECVALCTRRAENLWNRMPTHPDFLQIRVGIGTVTLPCEIGVPKQKLSIIDDELRDEPDRLKSTYSTIENAPVTVSLREEAVIGILGGMRAVLFAQGLLMQIATLHSYHDVKIAVLTEESSVSQWAWVRWLPHVFASEDRELRMVAYTPNDVHDVAAHLEEVLTIRKNNAAESSRDSEDEQEKDALPLPHYVIFCTNYSILENELVMRSLLTNRQGMTLVMIGASMTQLPKECHVVLNMQGGEGYMHSSEGDTQKIDFEYPDRGLMLNFSRSMAPMRVRDVAENAAIPTLVSFLDIYNVRRVEDLEIWRMWTENHTYDGLKSIIGYRAGSQPFVLDISDRFHGPHGLIAGTTGSGKSVMLETYILSLALNYSPRQVQFILIDYKGGGMADSFRELPHVAGIIDNLQGPRVIDRALASLNGEIHRREKIFKEVGINNINEYTQQYGDVRGREMPHLIIIVDEFAELKSEQPEFMRELVSASRVGRSLGIHLILATQKPSNSVSDEIWANSRFHLCLRVQTRQDSMEMLRRPDAAYIKGMGRCFIQIGNDEEFHQVQTSYSKLEYKPDEPRAEEIPQLLTPTGHVVRVKRKDGEEKAPTQMDAVLGRIYKVAREHGMASNRQLWLPALPKYVYFNQIEMFRRSAWNGLEYPNPQGNIRMLVGLADDVANQRYLPFVTDLTQNRNLIIVGLAGSGKTTVVQSMVYSLCSVYDAAHLNIYVLSLTSQTLKNLTAFPQVGDVVVDGEELELKRMLNMLYDEMNRRADMFAAASTDSFVEFNNARIKRGEAPEPAIVVFVDRYMQLREFFANDDFYTARIQTMLQEGSGRGIHFVVTAMAKNEVPMKLQSCFGGLSLQLKDRSDYSEVVGKVPYDMPPIESFTGRGMGRLDGKLYEIQFAMGGEAPRSEGDAFVPLEDVERFEIVHGLTGGKKTGDGEERPTLTDSERGDSITAYAQQLRTAWKGELPPEIPRLPQDPTWETLLSARSYADTLRKPFAIPVGYDMVSGSIATIKTESSPSWMVYGPRRSGVTNFLKLMARVMTDRGADVHILAGEGWTTLAEELNATLYRNPEEIAKFFDVFITQYARERKPLHDAAMAKGKQASLKQAAEFKPCCILVDNAEKLYADFSRDPYVKYMQTMQGLLGEIVEKTYYNFTLFMGVSGCDRSSCMYDPLKRLAAQGRAIALGGKLGVGEFDPCNVGAALPSRIRGSSLPMGQGFVGDNGMTTQIVVPLAEKEEPEEI